MPRPSPDQRTLQPPRQRVLPVQDRARRRLEAILDAAATLLAQQGLDSISTQAIAAAAGTTPATVYHYFENRQAVFAALAQRTMAAVDARLAGWLETLASGEALSSQALLESLYRAYREAPGYVAVLRALRAEPALQEIVSESNRRVARVMAPLLVRRTRLPRARAERVAWILSEACEQVLQAALMAEARQAKALLRELAEMVDALLRHYAGDI